MEIDLLIATALAPRPAPEQLWLCAAAGLYGLSEPGGSRDQKEPCTDGDSPDGLRESFTGRRETFDGDRCRHGSHRAKIHDPDDQEDCH